MLSQGGGGRSRKRRLQGDPSQGEDTPAAASPGVRRRGHAVDDQFRVSTKAVAQHGRIFEGHTYCVLESEFSYAVNGTNRKFSREDVSSPLLFDCTL